VTSGNKVLRNVYVARVICRTTNQLRTEQSRQSIIRGDALRLRFAFVCTLSWHSIHKVGNITSGYLAHGATDV